jgi:hypothetical protein
VSTEVSPSASVKLDGSGNGQISLAPPAGTTWRLRLANVSTTGTASQPQCFLYRGSTSGPLQQIDSTYLGNSASSGKVAGAPFFQGQVLWAKWTGGDPGATATLQVYGQQLRRGETAPFDESVAEGFPLNVATVFRAGNTIINSAGMFIYSAAPALGTLASTVGVETAGTDSFGNAYLTGDTSYQNNGSFWSAVSVSAGIVTWYMATTAAGPWTSEAGIGFSFNGITGGGLVLTAPAGISGALSIPQSLSGSIQVLPADGNSGSTWVSGERAFMNNNWINPINSNFDAILAALAAAGIAVWPTSSTYSPSSPSASPWSAAASGQYPSSPA